MLWVQSLARQVNTEAVGTEVQGHPWLQGEFKDNLDYSGLYLRREKKENKEVAAVPWSG